MLVQGRHLPLSKAAIVRTAQTVLRRERRQAILSLTFVGRDRMRALNTRWKRRSESTDVLAFALAGPDGALAGDVYICRSVAQREARVRRIPLRQELTRLVVHGVLHVLGYDHPDGPEREASAMWQRQERYVRMLR
ncbi:MAG TPA: rRNA maturation RNase YbeY [Gemmatimonadales bacterium]|nr:rRNA maturation RNase YbeY [Gemmatimonadales bacterium]